MAFQDSHMKPVYEFGGAWIVETICGTEVIPDDLVGRLDPEDFIGLDEDEHDELILSTFGDYLEGKPIPGETPEHRLGVLYRLSASGYLDCTPWGIAETIKEAKQHLEEMYGE